nr:hypothetical protein [Tanacetum cinerariifolium]
MVDDSVGNQIAQDEEAGIRSTQEEFEFVTVADAHEETKRVNVNYTSDDTLQQAFTSGTQSNNAPVYDSDGSAEANAKKSKELGSKGSLASSMPSKPRTCLRWIPTGRIFAMCGKLTASSNTENKSEKSVCDNASTSNPLEPSSKGFLNSASLLGRSYKAVKVRYLCSMIQPEPEKLDDVACYFLDVQDVEAMYADWQEKPEELKMKMEMRPGKDPLCYHIEAALNASCNP